VQPHAVTVGQLGCTLAELQLLPGPGPEACMLLPNSIIGKIITHYCHRLSLTPGGPPPYDLKQAFRKFSNILKIFLNKFL
jgi:hypothetical protein